jgi:hypothetical protein
MSAGVWWCTELCAGSALQRGSVQAGDCRQLARLPIPRPPGAEQAQGWGGGAFVPPLAAAQMAHPERHRSWPAGYSISGTSPWTPARRLALGTRCWPVARSCWPGTAARWTARKSFQVWMAVPAVRVPIAQVVSRSLPLSVCLASGRPGDAHQPVTVHVSHLQRGPRDAVGFEMTIGGLRRKRNPAGYRPGPPVFS